MWERKVVFLFTYYEVIKLDVFENEKPNKQTFLFCSVLLLCADMMAHTDFVCERLIENNNKIRDVNAIHTHLVNELFISGYTK